MALTPSVWFNGLVVPVTWLQAVTNAINGTGSFYSVTADGVGGQVVTAAPAGTIKPTGTAASTSLPTSSVTKGLVYADNVVFCFGSFASGGGLQAGFCAFNVQSHVKNSTGNYTLTFKTGGTTGEFVLIMPVAAASRIVTSISTGTSSLTYTIGDASGTATDTLHNVLMISQ